MSALADPPASSNGHSRKADGVRTYRGRTIEELIPKIRAELGSDAIILREREGLMGGINGFFAQRFVEVEARAGAPRVDVYDDDDELGLPATPAPTAEQSSFAAHLEHATPPPPPDPSFPSAVAPELPLSEPFPEQPVGREPQPIAPEPQPVVREPKPVVRQPQPPLAPPQQPPAEALPVAAEPRLPSTPEPVAGPIPVVEPGSVAIPEFDEPIAAERALPAAPAANTAPARTPAPKASARPAEAARRGKKRSSGRLARALAGGSSQQRATAAAAKQIDGSAAGAVARELIGCGISETWAQQLIFEAAAHTTPFAADGGLRAAVRSALASSLTQSPPLPAAGAAIAFVGAGGAGKTRSVATFASAYRRLSTLPVTVLSLGRPEGRRELAELLKGEGVSVTRVADGKALARRVEKARTGGIVIIDTGAVVSSDPAAVEALAAELQAASLDAVYVALPATLGAETGRRLMAGLAPLQPTGIAVTHADETDQLGVAVELSWASRTPIGYVHEGLDIRRSLTATDPYQLASRLLP